MNKVYSYRDSVEAFNMPTRASNAQDTDHWHLGDADGVHYFTFNPDTITLADNPDHDQRVYESDEDKAELVEVLPRLHYLQQRLQEKRAVFMGQYDEFTKLHAIVNDNAAFKAAVNSKHAEINSYITSLGF